MASIGETMLSLSLIIGYYNHYISPIHFSFQIIGRHVNDYKAYQTDINIILTAG